ncbi:ESX secretion-associated protein EspG [Rhodococcus sp. 24CO]|uniref:ESX secretion-associated protein EspG n=1 Tax=Rhodococcus sp. 24CO TaxID=3117460 RepID=UPI003D32D237
MNTQSQWHFTGMEFQILWEAVGRDRLPYPLKFRPAAETMTELTMQRKNAALRIQQILDESMTDALQILAEPTVRIEVSGFHGPRMNTVTRLHGAIVGEWGVLVQQLPGAAVDSGSDVVLSVQPASVLVSAMVTHLPQCPAGKLRVAPVRNTKHVPGESILSRADVPQPAEELGRFFRRPRSSIGEITIASGSAVDSRPHRGDVVFQWNDFAADGRYIVRGGETLSAVAASALDVETAIMAAVSTKRQQR